MSGKRTVVLDNGTGFIKSGYAGANFPSVVCQTCLGRPVLRSRKQKSIHTGGGDGSGGEERALKEIMCGDETAGLRHLLDMNYPVRNGVIQDMDEMCLLWDHIFYEEMGLGDGQGTDRSLAGHQLLLSEMPIFSTRHREKLYEVMFERYGASSLQSAPQGMLSLYSNGLETGVAVESGEGITHCTPFFEGFALPKANRRVDLGGRNITEFLVRLLQRRGYSFSVRSDYDLVRRMKEMFCYAAVDNGLEKQLALETTVLEKTFQLPDGSTCRIGQERFEATEALFQPHLIDVECEGLSSQLWSCIQAADIDVRAQLYSHVVLSGGSTMFPGLPSRLEKDMRGFFLEKNLKGNRARLSNFKLRIEDPPRRKYMVFLGGAALATMTADIPDYWLSKKEWEESGVGAVRARFGTV